MLRQRDKISRRQTKELVLDMARNGDHSHSNIKFGPDADVKRFFKHNRYDFDAVVEECRDFSVHVTFFENLADGEWYVHGEGVKGSVISMHSGKEISSINGPGILNNSLYKSSYNQAYKSMREISNNASISVLLDLIVAGVTSIEAYIAHRVYLWNEKNPEAMLIDSKDRKITFDEKIDKWIPLMSNGKKIDKSESVWNDFKRLQKIRDDVAIHPKTPSCGMSYIDIAQQLNMFKSGIAKLLFQLHGIFNERVPAKIIRGKYYPEFYVDTQLRG
jgi:hypothetical protein